MNIYSTMDNLRDSLSRDSDLLNFKKITFPAQKRAPHHRLYLTKPIQYIPAKAPSTQLKLRLQQEVQEN